MNEYFLLVILFTLSLISCSSLADNQTRTNQSATLSNQINNEINKNPSDASVANAKVKQKFDPAKVVHLTPRETLVKTGSLTNAVLTLKIDEPFHVNSNPPSEKNFIPLEINVENAAGITVGKPIYPEGKAKTFAFSDKPLSVYAGETTVKLPLKANQTATKGQQTLSGQLKFQACDEEVCYPPQTVNFQMPVIIN